MSLTRPVNVGPKERIAAAALAGLLLKRLLRRPSLVVLFAFGCLVYRALSGHCYGYEWAGFDSCPFSPRREAR